VEVVSLFGAVALGHDASCPQMRLQKEIRTDDPTLSILHGLAASPK